MDLLKKKIVFSVLFALSFGLAYKVIQILNRPDPPRGDLLAVVAEHARHLIKDFHRETGRLPTSMGDLESWAQSRGKDVDVQRIKSDPWQQPTAFRFTQDSVTYEIAGHDGMSGTEDDRIFTWNASDL